MEGRADEGLFVSEELEKCVGVLSTSAEKIHDETVARAKLDILAAIVKSLPIVFGDPVFYALDGGSMLAVSILLRRDV